MVEPGLMWDSSTLISRHIEPENGKSRVICGAAAQRRHDLLNKFSENTQQGLTLGGPAIWEGGPLNGIGAPNPGGGGLPSTVPGGCGGLNPGCGGRQSGG